MLTTIEILDRLKSAHGSDYKTAKLFNVPTGRISNIRHQGGILTDAQGLIAAEILGIDPEFVISSLVAERSKNSPAFSILQKIADTFEPKPAAAAAIFSAFVAIAFALPSLPVLA